MTLVSLEQKSKRAFLNIGKYLCFEDFRRLYTDVFQAICSSFSKSYWKFRIFHQLPHINDLVPTEVIERCEEMFGYEFDVCRYNFYQVFYF